jgi:hypothetical protein
MIRERTQQVHARVAELLRQANELYGIRMPQIDVRCNLRGKCAGMAGYRVWGQFYVRFNIDMIGNDSWEHIIRETVPHEVAHIVCFFRKVDDGHGRAWQATCRALGGTGERCHKEAVTYAKGRTYYYRTTVGKIVALSQVRHRRVQQGQVYVYRDGGRVTSGCAFSLEAPGT